MTGVRQTFSCACIGPQKGEPFCPCRMRLLKEQQQKMPMRARPGLTKVAPKSPGPRA